MKYLLKNDNFQSRYSLYAPTFKDKSNIRKNNVSLEVTKFGCFGLAVLHLMSEKIADDDLSLCMFSMAFLHKFV
jgi:hypothetical protein